MSIDPTTIIAELLPQASLAHLSAQAALDKLSPFVDAVGDLGHRAGLEHAIKLAATIRPQCTAANVAVLDYFEGNAWSCLRRLNHREGQDPWAWRQPELIQEVMCFRRALKGSAYLPLDRQLPMLTNLGNIMSHLGRQVEALAYYDRAMELYPKYSMTLGNRAQATVFYSIYHYDHGHKHVFLARARDDFSEALKYPAEPGAHEVFKARLTEFDQRKLTSHLKDFDLHRHSLGRLAAERRFRQWALKERLFLNPLNDLGPFPIAARDVLQLPNIVTRIAQGPTFHGFFNQLKQEYAAARWFCYEALSAKDSQKEIDDIADRQLMLVDAQDCARFGLQLEKLKLAFRAAYSLLDKIAFFINAYLDLGLDLKQLAQALGRAQALGHFAPDLAKAADRTGGKDGIEHELGEPAPGHGTGQHILGAIPQHAHDARKGEKNGDGGEPGARLRPGIGRQEGSLDRFAEARCRGLLMGEGLQHPHLGKALAGIG